MYTIHGLPADGKFRMAAWFDRLTRSINYDRSGRVTALVRDIAITDVEQLSRITEAELRLWFRGGAHAQPYLGHQRPYADDRITVDVVELARASIGDVFQGQRLVGRLPMSELTVCMTEDDCDPTWSLRQGKPRQCLDDDDYGGIARMFPKSRYLVIPHENIDVFIARTEIFTRFYGPHESMARIFAREPWYYVCGNFLGETQRLHGILEKKTQRGDHYVLLEPSVPLAYARLLANLYLHPYGRECASSIYTYSLMDMHDRDDPSHSHFSARIPYRATTADPRILCVQGWFLSDQQNDLRTGRRTKFLATRILSCSEPRSQPQVWYGYKEETWVAKDQLKRKGISTLKARPRNEATNPGKILVDPSSGEKLSRRFIDFPGRSDTPEAAALIHADAFFITDAKPMKEMFVESRYNSYPRRSFDNLDDLAVTSRGGIAHNRKRVTVNPLSPDPLIRRSVQQFRSFLRDLTQLVYHNDVLEFQIYRPQDSWQIASCGGMDCWSFLDRWQRKSTTFPHQGWKRVRSHTAVSALDSFHRSRVALIVRLVGHLDVARWIEIENGTGESHAAVLIVGEYGDINEAVQDTIACIGQCEGRDLETHLVSVVLGRAKSVHVIPSISTSPGESRPTSPDHILSHLVRVGVTVPRHVPTVHLPTLNALRVDANEPWSYVAFEPLYRMAFEPGDVGC